MSRYRLRCGTSVSPRKENLMLSLKAKRVVAIVAAPLAGLGLMISLTGLSPASADISGSNATGSSVGTIPACSWHLVGVSGSVSLVHSDSSKYKGLDYPISGSTSSSVDSYVAPSSASTKPSSPQADDCSWYGNEVGAQITIATTGTPMFAASSPSNDTSMDFTLSDSSHKLSATVSPSCDAPWSTPAAGANDIYSGHTSAVATSLAESSVSTTSNCSYTVGFSVTVPGGMTPTNSGTTYVMSGPALTTTLVTSNS